MQVASAQSIQTSSALNWSEVRASSTITLYLPLVAKSTGCPLLITETYGTVAPISTPTDRPAEIHADLNLAMRNYTNTTAYLGLIDDDHPIDSGAPQLPGLFGDNRTGVFRTAYQVFDWDWQNNRRGARITDPPVTLAGLLVTSTETVRVPASGYDIGKRATGYEVMVLYANTNRITLTYTRNDNVVYGYTLHIENICVEPRLLALYQSMNAAGRTQLPALYAGQGIGTAIGNELGVAIRDTGSFMDPRWRKDWWQGR
ncbi:MAG: hypothetical protein HZB51_33315 [Chloroflexi bacterium]|nr:hypothetical protein [Chloroflexota bacterium]